VAYRLFLAGLALAGSAAAPASLAEFEAHLASQDSATEAMQQWCRARQIGKGPIRAAVVSAQSNDAPARMRRILHLGDDGLLAMRNVKLSCDGTVLSVAWNWYAPARLTQAMNAALKDSDVPFGRVAGPLRFRRETLGITLGSAENCPGDTISTHRSLLRLPDGEPLAYLIECYAAANLAQR
jgi:chorismate-pyruvate lyase